MAGRGNPFPRSYSTSDSFESNSKKPANLTLTHYTIMVTVEAWKFAGNNSKGFSPVNVPN